MAALLSYHPSFRDAKKVSQTTGNAITFALDNLNLLHQFKLNMAPTRPSKKSKAKNRSHAKKSTPASTKPAKQLLAEATALLEQGDAPRAVTTARQALDAALENDDTRACAAHMLLGEINVELGEIDAARAHFLEAAGLDEDGSLAEELGGGPEKFNWLAQLSEEGGAASVRWV